MSKSYYKSEKRLDMLDKRVQRCVCKSCGGALSLRELDFHDYEGVRVEMFCDRCGKLEFGIEPEIYTSAEYYVEEYQFNLYPELGNNGMTKMMSISRTAEIMHWALKNLGYVNDDGFVVAPNTDGKVLGECLELNDNLIAQLQKEMDANE